MVSSDTLFILKSIISKYLPDLKYKVFIFGSRTHDSHRKFSDLDIGILGPSKVSSSTLTSIQNDISDSDIPYLTDVVDFSSVPANFKNKVLPNILNI